MSLRYNFLRKSLAAAARPSFARSSHVLAVHRNTKLNNPSIPFEFTPENQERAREVIAKYPPQYKKGACMPLLDIGQRQLGFTSISVMNYVAKLLEMPPHACVRGGYFLHHVQP